MILHPFAVDTDDHQVGAVERIRVVGDVAGDDAHLRIRVALRDQVGQRLRLVDAEITRVGHMPHDVRLFEGFHINQREAADAAHGKAERDESAARPHPHDHDVRLRKPMQAVAADQSLDAIPSGHSPPSSSSPLPDAAGSPPAGARPINAET